MSTLTNQTSPTWKKRSLVKIQGLSEVEIRSILTRAKDLKKLWKGWRGSEFPHRSLHGKTIVNLFFESSTRTRSSFELAARRLGAYVLNLQPETSSVTKGETLFDTAKNLEAMEPDLLILRHASAGAPEKLAKIVKVPLVNAGDGFHEHPTQALLDVFTIEEHLSSVKNLKVTIVGDIAHSRVARSNIYALNTLGAKVSVCGPPSLLPPAIAKLGVEVFTDLKSAIHDADVIMMLRLQTERQNQMQIPSLAEYSRFWGLNTNTIKAVKKKSIIMHPGPLNEGVEISHDVANGEHSVILDQVSNGVILRMALMEMILI